MYSYQFAGLLCTLLVLNQVLPDDLGPLRRAEDIRLSELRDYDAPRCIRVLFLHIQQPGSQIKPLKCFKEDDCLLVSIKLCLWGVICSLMMELRCRMQVCFRSFSTCRLCDTVTVPIPPYLSSLSSPPLSTHVPTHTPPFLSPHTPSPSIISVCSSFKNPAVISTIN